MFKVFVVPPDQLYLPVIAEKIRGKLFFHCCHTCAKESAPFARRLRSAYTQRIGEKRCPHSEEQRGFVSTVDSMELELALSRGYRVTWLYSVYHWEEWSDQLFRPYVQQMMKLKVQNGGESVHKIFCCLRLKQAVGPGQCCCLTIQKRSSAVNRNTLSETSKCMGSSLTPNEWKKTRACATWRNCATIQCSIFVKMLVLITNSND